MGSDVSASSSASSSATSPASSTAGADEVTITILGTSGSYPGPGSACSGYLLRHQGFSLWLDAGPGTMANLQTHVGLADVDAVVLSHQHPDHWSDLDGFYIACRYIQTRSEVPIYAPAGLCDLMRSEIDDKSPFDWHEITDQTKAAIGPFHFTFSRTDHPPETLAARIEAAGTPRVLGYTADTGPAWAIGELGLGLDLVLSEATFLQDKEGTSPHMSARQAGTAARAAQAKRLLLTHIWPIVDPEQSVAEAREAFDGPVDCARMNATYQL
jgi:ribonuclease BN (tRNA processing enzyme)